MQAMNMSAKQFASEIGVQPSGMSHILSGRNNPSLDFVMKVAKRFPQVSIEWLLFGKGSMFALDGAPSPEETAVEELVADGTQMMLFASLSDELQSDPSPAVYGAGLNEKLADVDVEDVQVAEVDVSGRDASADKALQTGALPIGGINKERLESAPRIDPASSFPQGYVPVVEQEGSSRMEDMGMPPLRNAHIFRRESASQTGSMDTLPRQESARRQGQARLVRVLLCYDDGHMESYESYEP